MTELLREAIAKGETEEGRRELAGERKLRDAEALQIAQEAAQAAPVASEAAEDAQTGPWRLRWHPGRVRPDG